MRENLVLLSLLLLLVPACNGGGREVPAPPAPPASSRPTGVEVRDEGPYSGEVIMVVPEIRKVLIQFEEGLQVKVGDLATIHRDGKMIGMGRIVDQWEGDWRTQILESTAEPAVGDKARLRSQ